jgi:myo-inositol-1(or 4)-monophosphatase
LPENNADLDVLLALVRQAGALALAMQAKGFSHTQKPDGTFVTDVDLAVDAFLKSRIAELRPEDGWLSEETPDSTARIDKSRLWIADPIDGTRGFLQGSGPWGIGMALVVDGIPAVAALFCPADTVLFHALRNGGCYANGLRVTTASHRTVITARRYRPALADSGFVPETDSPIPLLLRLASIAHGKHGAAISTGNKNDWDIAAGHLLVTEAGGAVTNLAGGPIVYNQPDPWQPGLIAAADAATHAAVLKIVRG